MFEVLTEVGMPSQGLIDLRKRVYVDEVGYLTHERLLSEEDAKGFHFVVKSGDSYVGAVQLLMAEQSSEFLEASGLSGSSLTDAVHITRCYVDPNFRNSGCFRLALYFALRHARIMGRKRLVCIVEDGDIAARRLVRYEYIQGIGDYRVDGAEGRYFQMRLATKPIDAAIHFCYSGFSQELQDFVRGYFVDEVEKVLASRSSEFISNCPWVQKTLGRSLTRDQYIHSLANMYQFVRDTTRIIAQAAALTESPKLRNHFIGHLQGEIDHEVQIESDLRHLGFDVEFVKTGMVPSPAVEKFRFVQEALLGWRADPELYVAVPFSIEAFSSQLGHEFLIALEDCISSWGGYNPKRASTFIRVHIEEDGGDGGHWDNNLKIIKHVLHSERRVAQFINIIHITMDAIAEMYSEFCSSGLVTVVQYGNHRQNDSNRSFAQ